MKIPNPKQHLDRLIRARYPVIQIVSHEERRVQNAVAEIAQAQGKAFFVWTASRGTRNATPDAAQGDEHELGIENPIPALEWFARYGANETNPEGEPAILLAKDLHPFFQDPVTTRSVRDLAGDLVTTVRTLFILSPALNIPSDAGKDIAAMDWPLPTEAELAQVLADSIDNLPPNIPIDLNGDGSKAFTGRHPAGRGFSASPLSAARTLSRSLRGRWPVAFRTRLPTLT